MDINIFDILSSEQCAIKIRARKKNDILRELVSLAAKTTAFEGISQDDVLERLKKRETQGSTGIGNGIAIPHASVPGMKEFVLVLAVSKRGKHFEAIDKHKVHIFALILGPENQPKLHIQLLAQLSHILRDESVRIELANSRTQVALYENFIRHCQPISSTKKSNRMGRKIVILVLQKRDYFEDVVEYLTELGVGGAAIIESTGIRNILTGMPLFADFIQIFGERSDETRTMIFTISDDNIDSLISGIEEITGDLETHLGAMLMIIEPTFVKGSLDLL